MHTLDEIYEFVVDTNNKVNGGSCEGAPVEKTRQTTSYHTGDDGNLEKGVAWPVPRFTDNGDGTVTDELTGLIWLKDASCLESRSWADAFTYVNNLNSGSDYACDSYTAATFGDWRLPNVKELQSLIDYGNHGPCLPSGHLFTGVVSNYYWSSTTNANSTGYAWYVFLDVGHVRNDDKDNSNYVWPVRGGE